jgi:hypothetical protein
MPINSHSQSFFGSGMGVFALKKVKLDFDFCPGYIVKKQRKRLKQQVPPMLKA